MSDPVGKVYRLQEQSDDPANQYNKRSDVRETQDDIDGFQIRVILVVCHGSLDAVGESG